MKSYSVKSNAKRAARMLAAKWPGLEPVEPVATDCDKSDWLPALRWTETPAPGAVVPDIIVAAAIIQMPDGKRWSGFDPSILAEGDAGVYAAPTEDMSELEHVVGVDVSQSTSAGAVSFAEYAEKNLKHIADAFSGRAVEVAGGGDVATSRVEYPVKDWHAVSASDPVPVDGEAISLAQKRTVSFPSAIVVLESSPGAGLRPHQQAAIDSMAAMPGTVIVMKGTDAGKTTSALDEIEEGDAEAEEPLTPAQAGAVVAALAALPPRVKRTKAEIASSREERRARINAGEYKAKTPAAKEVKVPKSTLVYEAIKAEGGASFDDLIEITAWQKHTLRGYIAGTLRARAAKEGLEIEAFKVKGEPTRYRALPA